METIQLEELLKAIEGYGNSQQPLTIGIFKEIIKDAIKNVKKINQ
jgi:hypothetical protein